MSTPAGRAEFAARFAGVAGPFPVEGGCAVAGFCSAPVDGVGEPPAFAVPVPVGEVADGRLAGGWALGVGVLGLGGELVPGVDGE